MNRINLFFISLVIAFFPACQPPETLGNEGKLKIVCTTGMIADAVSRVAGDLAGVESLMGPGVDPHLYKASQGDLAKLGGADMIFYNGLHLEGKMGEVLEKVGKRKPVIAVSEGVGQSQLLELEGFSGTYDPHIWFDVQMWSQVVVFAGEKLANQDPGNADTYRQRAAAYRDELIRIDEWVRSELGKIPAEQRVLITAHDAFAYFGRAYGVEVRGLQGISTMSEYGLRDVSDLVEFISSRRIPAIFVESSVPAKSLEAVAEGCRQRGHEVAIGGTLYSDAMGAAGTQEGTYTGMVKANVQTIVHALNEASHAETNR
ncbi:MAG: zinc ABC transporter substrate-binding protein [Saprospiraceae bacterium]